MHEAGIAVAVAAELLDRGLDASRVRLMVSGGHGDMAAFDAALRAQLEAAAPGLGLSAVTIAHAPGPRLCAHCATQYRAAALDAPCTACGGPGIALSGTESVELAWDESETGADEGPDRPGRRDPWPSNAGARGRTL